MNTDTAIAKRYKIVPLTLNDERGEVFYRTSSLEPERIDVLYKGYRITATVGAALITVADEDDPPK